ncbi:MAG: tetratricopeptide repeat protein [Pseudomonadota bacterium]
MERRDRYGNGLRTESDAARDAYIEGVDQILAAGHGAVDALSRSVGADPGFALGHAGLARAQMMAGQMAAAKDSIATAKALAADSASSRRERSHIEAMTLLLSGQAAECRELVLQHADEFPRDALAVQLCTNAFGLIGFSGATGREAALLAYTARLLTHYGEDWWMLSMHALSLCETGQLAASAQLMDRALDLNPANANASHFKAHAQYEAGETDAGLAFLKDWIQSYDARGVLHGHLSWHIALWSLHAGDVNGMWDMVDSSVAPSASQGLPLNILTDTAAILYRAELAGVDVAQKRWTDLSAYAAQFFPNPGQSFADMHAALAHAMAGQGELLARIAESTAGFAGDLIGPVARAWGAIARQDWAKALDELTPVMAQTERIGGSRAQRDLLEFAYTNVVLKLGQPDAARRVLMTRRPVHNQIAPVAGLN